MIKVYSQQKPSIVMGGTNTPSYTSGDLEAYIDGGKISVRRTEHKDIIIAWQVPHTDFIGEDDNIFGTVQETVDALNNIYNSESFVYTNSEIDAKLGNTDRDFVMDIDNIFLT